jgi:NAD(P)-dependent dehydrogenase (short-subunit alcohol dehydrogenase family)
MSQRFDNKTILITGAASGLGLASAIQLAREGARLVLVDVNSASLDAAGQAILCVAPKADFLLIAASVTDEAAVQDFVRATVDRYTSLDGFLNNAGVEGKQNPTADYPSSEFQRVIDVNLNGVFYGLKHVLAVMKAQGFGSIVNMASVGGLRGVGNQAGYSASKHGVVGLTRNAGVEYGQYGIRINAVAPGAIMTPMVEGSLRQMGGERWQEVGQEFVSVNPMKRFGKPEEVAHLVAFLLSDESTFINATAIPIDGGQSFKY